MTTPAAPKRTAEDPHFNSMCVNACAVHRGSFVHIIQATISQNTVMFILVSFGAQIVKMIIISLFTCDIECL